GKITGYAQDAERLLSIQSSVLRLEGQQAALQEATKEINSTLSGIEVAESLIDQLTTSLAEASDRVDSRSNDSFAQWQSEQATVVDNLLSTLTATLNTRVGEQYIFAGGRYSSPPSVNLTELAALGTAELAATAATESPALSFYDVGYTQPTVPPADPLPEGTNDNATAFRRDTVFLTHGDPRQFGISSNHGAFQELVTAALGFKDLVTTTGDLALDDIVDPSATFHADRRTQVAQIRDRLQEAKQAFEVVRVQESYVLSDVSRATERTETEISNAKLRIAELQNVNTEEVAILLSNLNLQFQASLETLSREYNLSLVNYLR
nr:hypothetical protein [Alphaproteobacteria bacterium]